MKKQLTFRLKPSEAADELHLKKMIAAETGTAYSAVSGFTVLKKSIDARSRQVYVNVTLEAFLDEPYIHRSINPVTFRDVSRSAKTVLIIGAGPAGLFAALKLLELGIRPVIVERGKDVKARRRDLAVLNRQGIINPESNYCFGEGGAGTYSDGKLYTRSTKRGDVSRILQLLVQFGAAENILFESHPHVGTNKLPQIITAIRKQITDCGGDVLFEKKVVDFRLNQNKIAELITADGTSLSGDAVILATGHSARDIFLLLQTRQIAFSFKPFAMGVRVEHPQALIDSVQYHCQVRDSFLPPASYSLVEQVNGKGVFSFCMCPGGIIATASTNAEELVVNGWSPSKRNNPYANSGMVVSVEEKDIGPYVKKYGALAGMYFQQEIEQKAYAAGGGKFVAPAQRMVDFTENKLSATLPGCSYLPGIKSAGLTDVLPQFISTRLQTAFRKFGRKMKGYYSNEAVLVATESRTSSPVRIPRHPEKLCHPQIENLYPCGEGAGYAGGIVSAAMDGEKTAIAIAKKLGAF